MKKTYPIIYTEPRGKLRIDYTGRRYGHWTVRNRAYFIIYSERSPSISVFTCKCDCGTIREIPYSNLISGNSTQCAKCQYRKMRKHGLSGSKALGRIVSAIVTAKRHGFPFPMSRNEAVAYFKPELHEHEFLVFDGEKWGWKEEKRRYGNSGATGLKITIEGVTKNLSEWGEELNLTRERTRQLYRMGKLEQRVKEYMKRAK